MGLKSLVGEGPEKAAEVNLSTGVVREVRDKYESSSIDELLAGRRCHDTEHGRPLFRLHVSTSQSMRRRFCITTTLLCYSQGRHIADCEPLATHSFLGGRSRVPRWSIFMTRRLSTCSGLKHEEPPVTAQK